MRLGRIREDQEEAPMKVALGSVVKGLKLKTAIREHLSKKGHQVIDVGCHSDEQFVKFPSVGQRIAAVLQSGEAELAINCCGSGTGASMAAGKFSGVCAVSSESVQTARLARVVNDANCLCMGELIVSPELACQMADAFLEATFQDADGIPERVLDFWREARDELMGRGGNADAREIEILPDA